jgi:lipopolysaccharide/colanic/teichoic acid biosynthesis glycosyltransferase
VAPEARRAPTRVRVWWEPLEAELAGRPRFFGDPIPASGRVFKRFLDLVLAPLLLLLAAPVLLASAIAIRLNSQGSTIFRQLRLGQDGRPFVLYKFRTMAQNNDDGEHRRYMASLIKGAGEPEVAENGHMHKLVFDRRITPVGRILRHFSIDELPQLWNVVRGEMTLVGPRPPLPHEVELYDARCWQRMRAKPGLTGLWQVRGRCELDFQRMVDIDIEYWRNWSALGELAILARTPWAVLTGRGAA